MFSTSYSGSDVRRKYNETFSLKRKNMKYLAILALLLVSCGPIIKINGVEVRSKQRKTDKQQIVVCAAAFVGGMIITDHFLEPGAKASIKRYFGVKP